MEFIRTIREKRQTAKQENAQKEAEQVITVSDFAGTLYIAYAGTPLVAVEENWTPKDILNKLSTLRDNYIRYRQSPKSIAMF